MVDTQKTAKRTSSESSEGFTEEERAMRERAQELTVDDEERIAELVERAVG